ncbi:MAG: glutamine--fructose-6-phosphate transaminase (isomerizing) [Candidatus Omnitrophota bacterium]|nr:MAG: glutamine--fructose-6-phosphate transaminase (isomerizing) [Candidatus Omnitrophota bacterium]
MCGIVGYIGKRNISKVLLESLQRLEYRGYDSSGIATLDNNDLYLCRETGCLENLAATLAEYPVKGNVGIGHTRWATHGEPSKVNAHPHTDCENNLVLVHNGIIENYAELRNKLKKNNHKFRSNTDSEIIVHIIEDYLKKGAKNLEEAVICTLMDLKGAYAIAALNKNEPEKMVAAKNGSSLILGIGKNEIFVASDASAVIPYTRQIVFLEDYQIAIIEQGKFNVINLNGNNVAYNVSLVDWDIDSAQKDGYAHFMLKEIHAQPKMLKKILSEKFNSDNFSLKLSEFSKIKKYSADINQIVIQACGTSFHAGMVGKFIFEYFVNLHTDIEISSEIKYKHFIYSKKSLIISITQSGETADTLIALRQLRRKGLRTISLCNVVGSTIARESDAVFYIHAGPEIGVASTKAYTAQLFALYSIGIFLGTLKRIIKKSLKSSLIKELTFIPSLMHKVLASEQQIAACAKKYAKYNDFFYLARGINYANALEGALKLKEVAYVHASAYPAGEIKHGPITLVCKELICVCIVTESSTYEKMLFNLEEIKARHGRVIAIATEGNQEIKNYADDVIYIPYVQEIFSPLLVALPLQIFAYYVALARGCNVDKPRNLAKSVTVE